MTTLRFARTLIVATCVTVLASGCCVTSMKFRKCQQPCPCESSYESTPLPLPVPQGTPPTFEAPPAPVPPPAPATSSTRTDLGVKSAAFFRSTGDKMKRVLGRS